MKSPVHIEDLSGAVREEASRVSDDTLANIRRLAPTVDGCQAAGKEIVIFFLHRAGHVGRDHAGPDFVDVDAVVREPVGVGVVRAADVLDDFLARRAAILAQAQVDAERWVDEGGSFRVESALPEPARGGEERDPRAEEELQNVLADVRRGLWRPPEPAPTVLSSAAFPSALRSQSR